MPTGPGTARKIPIGGVEPEGAELLPNGKGYLVLAKGKGESALEVFTWARTAASLHSFDSTVLIRVRRRCRFAGRRSARLPGKDGRLRIASLSGGEVTVVPGDPLEPTVIPVQWSADGRFSTLSGGAGLPARVDRVELATGRREPWKKLMPADPVGVVGYVGLLHVSRRPVLCLQLQPYADLGSVRGGRNQVAEPLRRHPPRPLRDPRAAGRGRDGGGVPGARHAAGARGRDQGAAGVAGLGSGAPEAIREGGAVGLGAEPPQHRHDPRHRIGERRLVHRDGAGRRHDAARAAGGRAAADQEAARRSRRRSPRAWPARTRPGSCTAT